MTEYERTLQMLGPAAVEAAARLVEEAPALTPEQRDQIAVLFRTSRHRAPVADAA